MTEADLYPEDSRDQGTDEIYDYTDESGQLLYQVLRSVDKRFRQRRPDGKDGWKWKLGNVRRVPYRLPELIEGIRANRTVLIAEGERKVDRLRKLGFVSTCNSGGAGKWLDEWRELFAGADVVILPDNDESGRRHAEQVARSLSAVAQSVKVVTLPELPEKGDIIDWLNRGHTKEELDGAIVTASQWTAAPQLSSRPEVRGHRHTFGRRTRGRLMGMARSYSIREADSYRRRSRSRKVDSRARSRFEVEQGGSHARRHLLGSR